jgi:hypothetical protein
MQGLQGIHIYDKFISCEKYKRLDRTTLGVICLILKKFKSKKIENNIVLFEKSKLHKS